MKLPTDCPRAQRTGRKHHAAILPLRVASFRLLLLAALPIDHVAPRLTSQDQPNIEAERDQPGKADPPKIRVGGTQDVVQLADNDGWNR